MPFENKGGILYWVNPKDQKKSKTRASKKGSDTKSKLPPAAFEEPPTPPTQPEPSSPLPTEPMAPSTKSEVPSTSPTKPEASSTSPTEPMAPSTKSEVPSTSPTKPEASSTSPTEPMAPSTKSEAPSTSPIESSTPSVEIQQFVMIIYFASRQFNYDTIQELLRRRFGETTDAEFWDLWVRAGSPVWRKRLFVKKGGYNLDRVDKWLKEQTSYDILMSLIKIDDGIRQVLEKRGRHIDEFPNLEIGKIRAGH